jgi:CMP/dCMP kinase
MKEIITLTGEIGSGKSTVGRILAAALGYEFISTGMIQRRFAAERGCTSLELNEASMRDPQLDDHIDSYLRRLNHEGSRLVLDSRLAWHFVEEAFDVFVYVDPCVGARRVLSDARGQEVHHDLADAVRNDLRRKHLENRRFADLYGAQCDDPDNFALILDSTWAEPPALADQICKRFHEAASGHAAAGAYLSPKSLYPTKNLATAARDESETLSSAVESWESPPREPIEIVRFSEYHFILAGHRRISSALAAGLDFVPCILRRPQDRPTANGPTYGEKVAASYDRTLISAWEQSHHFSFPSYPDAAGNPQVE